jgi:hypothetical protein
MFYLGAVTPNEIRESEGKNPYDGGDQFYIQSNLSTFEEIQGRAAVGADESGLTQQQLDFETLKGKFDAYGVAVRAGAITPQTNDETAFRTEAGLPVMSDNVQEAWIDDGGVRRPITLQSQSTFAGEQELTNSGATINPDAEDDDAPKQSLQQLMKYHSVIVDSLQPIINREAKYQENPKRDAVEFYDRQAQMLLEKCAVHLTYLNMELPKNFIEQWTENRSMLNWQETKAEQMADDLKRV